MIGKIHIVATVGPATKDKEMLKKLMQHRMNVARLNFSWGTYDEHIEYIKNIREAASELGIHVPVIQDLSGPRMQNEDGHEFNKEALQVITEKDLKDLAFGIAQNIEYVALSYVGDEHDVVALRKEMELLGKQIPIIAKIERKVALEHLEAIIQSADAIMIARGDLGNEIPLEKIPFVEKDIIEKCKHAGKPVIVATQVLLSMTESPVPTRAEMTDIIYAVMNGTDALMLSEETARGKYPLEAVTMMERGIVEAEAHSVGIQINNL